tara:strand:+ start:317 stop:601 length:285 start_codon:yes stop_codon:yes gene_type:complete
MVEAPSFLVNELQRQGHKYMVQRHIFCMGCSSVLDVRRAVSFDIYNADCDIVYAGILCGKCYDLSVATGGMAKAQAEAGEGGHMEIFDGRERWK